MIRRTFYGWLDTRRGVYRLSLYPPDAPVRPSIAFDEREDAEAYAQRRRAVVLWWPELPRKAA